MRVLIGAFGTRGDVQPLVALAQTLRGRGHQVTMVVPPESQVFVQSHGLEAHVAGMSYEEISRRVASGSLRDVLGVLPTMRAQVGQHFEVLEPLAREADVIVGASVFIAGTSLAERFGKPYVYVALVPQMLDSPENAGPLLSRGGELPRWINRLSWWVTQQLWNLSTLGPLNAVRKKLGLGPTGNVWRAVLGQHPVLAADPMIAPAPREHGVAVAQTGPLLLEDPRPLSSETSAFLEAGPPPVYLGFGSMSDPHPERTTRRLLEAVRRAGVRAVISRGWAGLGAAQAPEGVRFLDVEPHAALFPRCAGVVHHGGAGTTHAAALAGVPQVVMPQILDQFFWRHRTLALGVNPRIVPRYGDDPEPLAEALRRLATDGALRERARQLAKGLVRDGAQRAAGFVEGLVTR
jgi:UDP:flavonoid glycosyltransferase YjiC (YdhE family)